MNANVSQLKPWMRVSLPVKVVSMQAPQPKATDNKGESPENREKAIARVGDQTGVVNFLAVDQQMRLFETEGNCLYLVNAHCRLLKAKFLRLECDQWSQIKLIKQPPADE